MRGSSDGIARKRDLLGRRGIRFVGEPLAGKAVDPERILEAVPRIRAPARPLHVRGCFSPSIDRVPAAEAILVAWRTGLRPVAPVQLREGLSAGAVKVAAAEATASWEREASDLPDTRPEGLTSRGAGYPCGPGSAARRVRERFAARRAGPADSLGLAPQ